MKTQKLLNELNKLFDSVTRERQKHQKTLKTSIRQLKKEEQKLHKNLNKENNKISRKKLKRKLGMVQEAYDILNVA